MNTETIVAELQKRLDACDPVNDFMHIKDLRQQINAHGSLARLRAEHASNPSEKLAQQVDFWRRQVWVDVDPPETAPKPRKARTAAAVEPATDPVGE